MITFGKRIDGAGGRRQAKRQDLGLAAWMETLSSALTIVILDVSSSGAKVQGDNLPPIDTDLFVRLPGLDVFATVAWVDADRCGLAFDAELDGPTVERLRQEASWARITKLSPEQKWAAEAWLNGRAH